MIEAKEAVFVISSLSGGGAERVCATLANQLCDKGWDITIVTVQPYDAKSSYALNERVTVRSLNSSRSRHAFKKFTQLINVLKPSKLVLFNYEVLLLWFFSRLLLVSSPKIVFRNVNTLSQHRGEVSPGLGGWFRYFLINRAIYSSDLIIAQCIAMKEDLLRALVKLSADKVQVIYNPAPARCISHHQRSEEGVRVILCVGRLEKQKRFDRAIRSFAAISDCSFDVELWIAGDGSLREDLATLAKALGVGDKVKFLGYCPDVMGLYSKAHSLLLTSDYEGFPNVVVEALFNGLPVVSVNCPSGPSELIKDGENGFLVPLSDEEQLAKALDAVLSRVWSSDCIRQSVNHLASDKIADEYSCLLQTL